MSPIVEMMDGWVARLSANRECAATNCRRRVTFREPAHASAKLQNLDHLRRSREKSTGNQDADILEGGLLEGGLVVESGTSGAPTLESARAARSRSSMASLRASSSRPATATAARSPSRRRPRQRPWQCDRIAGDPLTGESRLESTWKRWPPLPAAEEMR